VKLNLDHHSDIVLVYQKCQQVHLAWLDRLHKSDIGHDGLMKWQIVYCVA